MLVVLFGLLLLSGCGGAPQKPEGVLTPDELLEDPFYNVQVRVYGEVGLLGELFCPCFTLSTRGKDLVVWYDMMTNDDHTQRPAVSVARLDNGDWVIVTGELKPAGGHHYSLNDFWASGFEVLR
jgi:hypothetical protein